MMYPIWRERRRRKRHLSLSLAFPHSISGTIKAPEKSYTSEFKFQLEEGKEDHPSRITTESEEEKRTSRR